MATDSWKVVFPRPLYAQVVGMLDAARPLEGGCYMTASWLKSDEAPSLLARSIVAPDAASWSAQGEGLLVPSPRYTHRAVVEADRAELCLLFVHSHPSDDHPAGFSATDALANARFFEDLSPVLGRRPLASIVYGRRGVRAVVGHGGAPPRPCAVSVVGKVLERHGGGRDTGEERAAGGAHARQAAALGRGVHGALRSLDVCIAGVGGIGSAVAVQLARMGVGRIRLVDPDLLEESNTSRLYGSERGQLGVPKVKVVGRHLRSFSESRVSEVFADIVDVLHDGGAAAAADVIVCCTDNLRSRDRLNEAALRWYKPLIDTGCSVSAGEGGAVSTAYAQIVTPDTACLWCTGQIDGKRLGDEFLTGEQKRAKAAAGYYAPEAQPSLVTYTTWAACLAVDKLLSVLGLYGGRHASASYVDMTNALCRHRSPRIKPDCVCSGLRPQP